MRKIYRKLVTVLTGTLITLSSAAQSFQESFDDVAVTFASGWSQQNLSSPIGTNPNWNQGTSFLPPPEGTGYIYANFLSVAGTNTISNWLFTPTMTLRNGDEISFWTKSMGSIYPDRLQLWLSTNGASTDVGTTNTSVGDFSTLLLDINPGLTVSGYPSDWTKYTVTISGLSGPTSGKVAFRYFVTNGGPTGSNSDYIGIDDFSYTSTACDHLANQSLSSTSAQFCESGTTNVVINSSQLGMKYYLRNDADDAVVDGPKIGTGYALPFSTGIQSSSQTFNVYAENRNNTAMNFDGVDDHIFLGYITNEMHLQGHFTIEMWFKINAFDKDWQALITKGDNSWRIHRSGNSNFLAFGTTGLSNTDLTSTVNVNDGNWHHVAAVYDGANKYIYIDGVLDVSVPVTGTLNMSSYQTYIGENGQSMNRHFNGLIDEVRIWDAPLSGSQISTQMNSCLTGDENNLILYFDMAETLGAMTYDKSINSNHGTLINMDPVVTWQPSILSCDNCEIEMTEKFELEIVTPNDYAFVTQNFSEICSANTTIEIDGSDAGINYYLKNAADQSVVDGPVVGTGSALQFSTGTITETTEFIVVATEGGSGSALAFDGVDDYVSVSNLASANGHYMEFDIYLEAYPAQYATVIENTNKWRMAINSSGNICFAYDHGGWLPVNTTDTYSLPLNQWVRVGQTYDNMSMVSYVFINGISIGQFGYNTSFSTEASGFVNIGGTSLTGSSTSGTLNGKLDRLILYQSFPSHLLSGNWWQAGQGNWDINYCTDPTESGVLAFFSFNEGSGGVLHNQTTGSADGTLTNMNTATAWQSGSTQPCAGGGLGCSATMNGSVVITINEINEQTVSASQTSLCDNGTVTISTGSSEVGVNYYLRNDANNSIIQGPIAGTGAALNFNTGTITTTTSYNVYAEQVGAINLPAATDHIRFSSPFSAYTNELTVEAWVNFPSTNFATFPWIGQSTAGADNMASNVWLWHPGGTATFFVNDNGTWRSLNFPAISSTGWHHVATVANAAGLFIYYDGVLVASNTTGIVSGIRNNAASIIDMGQDPRFLSNAGRNSNTAFDDFRVWNVARTGANIATNFQTCLAGNETGLVQYTRMNEGSGTAISSVKGSSGTIINGATNPWIVGAGACGGNCTKEMAQTATVSVFTTPTPDAPSSVAECDSYELTSLSVGNYYTASNGGGDMLPAGTNITSTQTVYVYAVNGSCSSENNFEVTITPSTSNTTTESACDSYTWSVNGQMYTSGGTYTVVTGCHTEELILTIITSTLNLNAPSSCDSYVWAENGQTYTASGTYTVTNGCHTEQIDLTITTSSVNTTTESACDSYTWAENGQTYTASGNYTIVTGCHTEELILTITNSTDITTTETACDSYTWAVNGQTYTAGGTFTEVTACNTEELVLTIVSSTFNSVMETACNSYTWTENGQTYTSGGTYIEVNGCHTEELVLTINDSPIATTTVAGETITASTSGVTYQWIDCDNGNTPISGATNQSFTATANGNYAVEVTENGCTATSSCVAILSTGLAVLNSTTEITLYPNPTNGQVQLNVSTELIGKSISITNTFGQIVDQWVLNNTVNVIDLSTVADGIYFIAIQTENGSITKKVVKN
jgi:hypothetical protein